MGFFKRLFQKKETMTGYKLFFKDQFGLYCKDYSQRFRVNLKSYNYLGNSNPLKAFSNGFYFRKNIIKGFSISNRADVVICKIECKDFIEGERDNFYCREFKIIKEVDRLKYFESYNFVKFNDNLEVVEIDKENSQNEDDTLEALAVLQTLSEEFIRTYKDKLNWKKVCKWQALSEDLIREFKDKVDWKEVSKNQELSESFIIEFQDDVIWDEIVDFQHLSDSFLNKFRYKFSTLPYVDKRYAHF